MIYRPQNLPQRMPPSLKIVAAGFLGIGPVLWMPCFMALEAVSAGGISLGWPSGAQLSSGLENLIFLAFWWWVMAFAGGVWLATMGSTLLAAVATWKLLHLIARDYPQFYRLPATRFASCFVMASAISALAFFLCSAGAPMLHGLSLIGSVALVGGVLGLLLGRCFRKVNSDDGASALDGPGNGEPA
jgi:hypothetical protein